VKCQKRIEERNHGENAKGGNKGGVIKFHTQDATQTIGRTLKHIPNQTDSIKRSDLDAMGEAKGWGTKTKYKVCDVKKKGIGAVLQKRQRGEKAEKHGIGIKAPWPAK